MGGDTADVGGDAANAGGEDAESTADESDMCAAQSFTPDTLVVLASGETEPISKVAVGQKVKAFDTSTGTEVTRTVSKLWVDHDSDLMDVTITSGGVSSTIHATQHHPFWDVTRNAWVDADELIPGDQLRSDNGATVTVTGTGIVTGNGNMWDLTITGVHDFYVSTPISTILVHNNTCSFATPRLLQRHFTDHGTDFGAGSAAEYEQRASDFLSGDATPTTLEKVRPVSGDLVRYDQSTEEFGIVGRNNVIKTYYIPRREVHGYPSNLEYFNAQ